MSYSRYSRVPDWFEKDLPSGSEALKRYCNNQYTKANADWDLAEGILVEDLTRVIEVSGTINLAFHIANYLAAFSGYGRNSDEFFYLIHVTSQYLESNGGFDLASEKQIETGANASCFLMVIIPIAIFVLATLLLDLFLAQNTAMVWAAMLAITPFILTIITTLLPYDLTPSVLYALTDLTLGVQSQPDYKSSVPRYSRAFIMQLEKAARDSSSFRHFACRSNSYTRRTYRAEWENKKYYS